MKRVSVVAVNIMQNMEGFVSIPLGLATVVSILEQRYGIPVEVLDLDNQKNDENVGGIIASYGRVPRIFMISSMITNFQQLRRIVRAIRKYCLGSVVVCGGSLASTAPASVLSAVGCDLYVRGEADDSLERVLRLARERLGAARCSKYEIVEPGDKSVDISSVLRPAYHRFNYGRYLSFLKATNRAFEMYASRGCPYRCSFCYKVSGSHVRHRRVSSVVEEVVWLRERWGISRFSFEDDCFASNRTWIKEFCREIKPMGIAFRCQTSINTVDERVIGIMIDAGLEGMSFGLETASPRLFEEAGKRYDIAKAERILRFLRNQGIRYNATFIVGFPSETLHTVKETKDFLVRNEFSENYQLFFLTPYPKTHIYEWAIRKRIIVDELRYIERMKLLDDISVNLTAYSDEILKEWRSDVIADVSRAAGLLHGRYNGVTWKCPANSERAYQK